jgi:DNA polymerase-1
MMLRSVNFSNLCNRHRRGETWPQSKTFKVQNDEIVAQEGKKASKFRTINLHGIVEDLKIDTFAPNGWPSVSIDSLKTLSGRIPMDQIYTMDDDQEHDEYSNGSELPEQDIEEALSYGTAYKAFGGGKKGKEACHAIAALCEISSIDKLISSFILPLQVSQLILLM